MSSLVSANVVSTGQVQSLDSVRGHALPSDALIFASGTQVNPQNQNLGSYAIVESGVNSLGVTTTGSVPAVTQSPFADLYKEGSLYFNGTAGNYLQNTATYSNSTIQWNTTGMTVEAWVNYPTFTGAATLSGTNPQPTLFGLMSFNASGDYWSFGANTTGYVNFYYYGTSSAQTVMGLTPLSANTWNHIAMTCSTSGQIFLFVNGVQSQVVANRNGSLQSASYYETVQGTPSVASYTLTVGQWSSTATNAYVADLRLTTGTPVYTGSTSSYATFTVPSAPLSTSATGVTQALIRAGQNSPTIQSGALTFDRGLKQFQNFGPQTFNIATRGFTAVFKYTWNGIVANNERIFQFTQSTSSPNNSFAILRNGTGSTLSFSYYNNSGTPTTVTTTGTLSQSVPYILSLVYSGSTVQWWVNGAPNASGTLTLASDPSLFPYTFIGCDYTSTANCVSASMNTLAVYNRALSNVEIYNSYLALSTTPQTPQNSTLEIGDVNGTPALRITGDGRVNIQKLGASSNVLPWPPAAMTGYVTSINGGTYVASASSEYNSSSTPAWYAFDKSGSTIWASSSSNFYAATTGLYTGTVTTTDVNGTSYLGDWLQLQFPTSIVLSNYSITSRNDNSYGTEPRQFCVLGSRDGVNWILVDSRTGQTGWSLGQTRSFTGLVGTSAFSYFRLVTTIIAGAGVATDVAFAEWTLYGTTDLQQPLSVTQPVTLNYGAQTSSLVGIPNPGVYAPQDFSSSALNIPAYVVSNTATVANTVAFSEFGPFAGEGSLYFPGGKGAYVNLPTTSVNISITSSTIVTFECWFYPTGSLGGSYVMFTHATPTASIYDWNLYIETDSKLGWYPSSGGGSAIKSTNLVNFNAWNHAAWSFSGGTVYVALNGTVASGSIGTPPNTSGWPILIGTAAYSGSPGSNYYGYIASARIISGLALYQTSFTPPTGPLQPIQGTTQAGLPYGTVLLLRNAPAPGRVLTSKFAGQNSSAVLPFPPAAMTTYATSLSSGYGQGTYVASASSELSGQYAWYAFDSSLTIWTSAASTYTASTGVVVSGGPTTVDINGNSYQGEWLQIQNPSSIVLSSYSLLNRSDITTQSPNKFWILGSRDGINWYLVDSRTGITWSLNQTQVFTVSTSQAFTYFRFVTNIINSGTTQTQISVATWTLNASIEGPTVSADGRLGVGVSAPVQQLEVAGNMVVNGTVSHQSTTFRNVLYNGDMRINQRGISTTLASPTAMGTSSTGYALDRWLCYRGSFAGGGYVAQGTLTSVDLPYQNDGLNNFFRVGRSVGDTSTQALYATYGLESKDSYRLAGKYVTMSFYYRTGSAFAGTLLALVQTGTGTDQNFSSGWTGMITQPSSALTSTSWTKYSFSVQVPISATQVGVYFQYGPTTATAVANDYFDVTGVQLEKGTIATPFEVRPYATELALCQRYYEQSYEIGVTPGSNTSNGYTVVGGMSDSVSTMYPYVKYSVPKRAQVVPTFYTTTGTVGQWTYIRAGPATNSVAIGQTAISTTSFVGSINTGATYAAGIVYGHWAVNAEL